jgi:hypothetical protein
MPGILSQSISNLIRTIHWTRPGHNGSGLSLGLIGPLGLVDSLASAHFSAVLEPLASSSYRATSWRSIAV